MTVTDGDLVDNAQIVRCVESLDHVRPGNRPDKLTRVHSTRQKEGGWVQLGMANIYSDLSTTFSTK